MSRVSELEELVAQKTEALATLATVGKILLDKNNAVSKENKALIEAHINTALTLTLMHTEAQTTGDG